SSNPLMYVAGGAYGNVMQEYFSVFFEQAGVSSSVSRNCAQALAAQSFEEGDIPLLLNASFVKGLVNQSMTNESDIQETVEKILAYARKGKFCEFTNVSMNFR